MKRYQIIMILNRNARKRVCEQYCWKFINLDKCSIESGLPLKIVYENGIMFQHEKVLEIEPFDEYGLMVTTTKKEWYIR